MTEPTPIDLDSLDEVVELTTALVEAYREAARVMLDRFYDDDDRLNAVIIRNDEEIAALLLWQKPTEQMRNSYDNLREVPTQSHLPSCMPPMSTL